MTEIKVCSKYPDYGCDEYGNVYSRKSGSWVQMNPTFNDNYYRVSVYHNDVRTNIKVHTLVYLCFYENIPENMILDHIDRNTKNNHISNLRLVNNTKSAKNKNKYKNSKSIYKGVSRNSKNTKWIAQIRINKILKHIGCYDLEIEAAIAYDKTASILGYTTNKSLGLLH